MTYWGWSVAPSTGVRVFFVILGLIFSLAFIVGVPGIWGGIQWAEVQGPAGVFGSTVEATVTSTVSTVKTAGEYTYNRIFYKNEQIARLQCIMEKGGPAAVALTPSTEISECVENKIGKNETVTQSNEVTDPVELQIEEPTIEPFRRRTQVSVPLVNTLVYDREGVPINIPARQVSLEMEWENRGSKVVSASESFDTIASGDTRVVEKVFSYPPSEDWWNRTAITSGVPEQGGRQKYLVPGFGYTLKTTLTYKFDAESAFTESSRWKSGNYLLKLWRKEAWESQTLDERDAWRDQNCDTVKRFGQEFIKQRTAALTTPVVPVMYTACGTSLFSKLDQTENPVNISVSATGSERTTLNLEKFRIEDVSTDCKEGDAFGGWNEVGKWQYERTGVGWTLNPEVIERTVRMEGERTTISCKVDMNITVEANGQPQTLELPDLTGGG